MKLRFIMLEFDYNIRTIVTLEVNDRSLGVGCNNCHYRRGKKSEGKCSYYPKYMHKDLKVKYCTSVSACSAIPRLINDIRESDDYLINFYESIRSISVPSIYMYMYLTKLGNHDNKKEFNT